jgi:DnaJ-class molecular chaperone
MQKDCPTCGGSGKVNGAPCPTCQGQRLIWVDVEEPVIWVDRKDTKPSPQDEPTRMQKNCPTCGGSGKVWVDVGYVDVGDA